MPNVKAVSGALAVVDLSEIPEDRIEELRLRTGLTVAFLEPGRYKLHRRPGGFEVTKSSRLVRVKRASLRLGVLATVGLVGVGLYRLPDAEAARTEYIATTGERIVVKGHEVEEVDPPTPGERMDHIIEAHARPAVPLPAPSTPSTPHVYTGLLVALSPVKGS